MVLYRDSLGCVVLVDILAVVGLVVIASVLIRDL